MSETFSTSPLLLDEIRRAELPLDLALSAALAHAAAMEQAARGEHLTESVATLEKALSKALPEWEPLFLLSQHAGEDAERIARFSNLLRELPDLSTIYPVGKLSVESAAWQETCPDRSVKFFGCFDMGIHGLLVLTSNQTGQLETFGRTFARLIAEGASLILSRTPSEGTSSQDDSPSQKAPVSDWQALADGLLQEAICLVDRSGVILESSSAIESLLGQSRQDITGEPLAEFGMGTEAVRLLKALATGEVTKSELRMRRSPHGQVIWVRARAQQDDSGKTAIVLQDVTHEKEIEILREKAQCQFLAASLSPSLLIFQVDRRGAVQSVEGGYLQEGNLKAAELVGRNVWSFCQDSNQRRQLWRQLRRHGESVSEVDSSLGHFKLTLSAQVGPNGKPQVVHGVAVPVATQAPVEPAPATPPEVDPQPDASEEWLQTFGALMDGIILTDRQAAITYMNAAAERLMACSLGAAKGHSFHQLGTFEGDDPLQKLKGDGSEQSYQFTRHDGEKIDLIMAGLPVPNTLDGQSMLSCRQKPVTEKELGTEELQRLEKENFSALATFAGGIAHDLNNILTSLVGNVSLANMLVDEIPEASERLVEAERACFRAKDLSHQLLTFAKGSAPVQRVLRLEDLVTQCSELYFRGSKAVPRINHAPGLWGVNVDEGQVSQVLENLILQADRSMPHGGMISISTANYDHVGDASPEALPLTVGQYVKVTVQDEGAGIPPDQLANIFKPYHTANESGRGLGLATTFTILKNHGGYITATSALGKGTTFTFYLPATGISLEPESHDITVLPPKNADDSSNGRILVIDDEKSIRDLATTTLKLMGCDVTTSPSSSEGVERFIRAKQEGCPFDLVIMDLSIPGDMGGNEAMQQILNIAPNARGIASSGYSDGSIMAHYREYGFQAALSKPYNIADLQRVVSTMLAG